MSIINILRTFWMYAFYFIVRKCLLIIVTLELYCTIQQYHSLFTWTNFQTTHRKHDQVWLYILHAERYWPGYKIGGSSIRGEVWCVSRVMRCVLCIRIYEVEEKSRNDDVNRGINVYGMSVVYPHWYKKTWEGDEEGEFYCG